jgi:glutaredoxin/glutathione-dependent peroxiredoxin
MIAAGKRVPNTTFQTMTEDGPVDITAREVFSGKSVILFGVPGAFTPSCHYIHLPSYIDEFETLRDAGIDTIACTAVNDVFVLDVWAQSTGGNNKILFLADGNADFALAAGLALDARALGLGLRSRRYALWARDGLVQAINIEEDPKQAEISTAYGMLKMLHEWTHAR